MIFPEFKEYRPYGKPGLGGLINYMSIEMKKILTELNIGLQRLSFRDNFTSFEVEVSVLPSGSGDTQITNQLDIIPTKRLIVRGGVGAEKIVDGVTDWDNQHVYLQNLGGPDPITVTVIFFK